MATIRGSRTATAGPEASTTSRCLGEPLAFLVPSLGTQGIRVGTSPPATLLVQGSEPHPLKGCLPGSPFCVAVLEIAVDVAHKDGALTGRPIKGYQDLIPDGVFRLPQCRVGAGGTYTDASWRVCVHPPWPAKVKVAHLAKGPEPPRRATLAHRTSLTRIAQATPPAAPWPGPS